ncbi:MAG: undecaprenyldiphospho-muramoylpentapeptide beta-N-acetylglucosaminyltransferase [Rhodospirillales bacterium]|nr:undecaprenyldiphospho-muramoylpentapeptide beta-N-acetylglucosaminyltransferase [Rhodospirillales bacterium]MDH3916649.1 undecaprenyldiphospho-muramoylpentapeptide beta-N-acetylglucosaminyltransferase [Rhodospirillales bacterium]
MNVAPPRKVVLAAGGTGGHMFPAEALARELLARGCAVALVTDRRGAGFGPDLHQVEIHRISAGGVAGGSALKKLKGLLSLAVGFMQARGLVKRLGADAVVGFGGYPSVPTVLAGAQAGLRVVLHEQNAVLGRANRLLASRAQAIGTCFARVEGLTPAGRARVTVTGNPVRPAITEVGRRPYAPPDQAGRLRLLVTGGSQGARAFNDLVPAAVQRLPEGLRRRLEVSQQVRGDALEHVAAVYRECGVAAHLAGFLEDMPERLAGAHLAICRAGASTIAELAATGRPAILVPYPFATDDHQTANAQALVDAGGAWLIPDRSLSPEVLADRLGALFATPALLARAAQCATAFAQPDAARRLANLVFPEAQSNGGEEPPKEAAA